LAGTSYFGFILSWSKNHLFPIL